MRVRDHQSDDRALFQRELAPGENLIWVGRPVPGRLFEVPDLLRLAMVLLFAGIPIYYSLKMFFYLRGAGGPSGSMAYVILVFAIPLFIVIIGVVGLGGVFKRRQIARNARYAITDRRVIIANSPGGLSVESVPFGRIPGITTRIGVNGVGTIVLAELDKNTMTSVRYSSDITSGMPVGVKRLHDIPNAEYVEGLLKNYIARNEAEAAASVGPLADSSLDTVMDTPYLSHPPRSVHPILALITLTDGLFQFSIFWLGFILIGARIVYPMCDRLALVSYFSPVETAPGVVTGLHVLGASGGEYWSGTSTKKYYYRYHDRNGTTHDAWQITDGGRYTVGKSVSVEYSKWFPGISRIAGLWPAADFFGVTIASVLLLVGVLMFVSALKGATRALKLLRNGEAAVGVFHSKVLRKDNNQGSDSKGRAYYWWDMVYRFKARDGSEHEVRSSESAGRANEDNPEAELKSGTLVRSRLFLLYSVSNPDDAITSDQLPGRPKFDQPGTVYSGKPWMLLGGLIIPTLVLLGHWLWWYYGR